MRLDVLGTGIDEQRLFGLAQRDFQRTDDLLRDVVLDLEDVSQIAVVSFGPEMPAARTVNQLGGDANPVAGLSDAAF